MKTSKIVIFFLMSMVILSGCSTTQGPDISGNTPGNISNTGGQNQQNYSGTSSLQSDGQDGLSLDSRHEMPNKRTVYFMYDSSEIQEEFIRTITAHTQYLMTHPEQRIVLEGHTDERGSREYNVALGEQRAQAVSIIMKVQGVADRQIDLVSYGEEKPVATGVNEKDWQLNRRVAIAYQSY